MGESTLEKMPGKFREKICMFLYLWLFIIIMRKNYSVILGTLFVSIYFLRGLSNWEYFSCNERPKFGAGKSIYEYSQSEKLPNLGNNFL